MGLGGTAKKLQKVIDAAEQLYAKMNEVIDQVSQLKDQVEATSDRVDTIDREVTEQRALLEALARKEGIDVESALEAADLPNPDAEEAGDETADSSADGAGDRAASPTE